MGGIAGVRIATTGVSATGGPLYWQAARAATVARLLTLGDRWMPATPADSGEVAIGPAVAAFDAGMPRELVEVIVGYVSAAATVGRGSVATRWLG